MNSSTSDYSNFTMAFNIRVIQLEENCNPAVEREFDASEGLCSLLMLSLASANRDKGALWGRQAESISK